MERYDWESGLVFTETLVKVSKRPPDRKRPKVLPYVPPLAGAESLYAKAMREIVRNASTLTPEALRTVPASIVDRIWRAVRREDQETLEVWKLFVNGGYGDSSFRHSLGSARKSRLQHPTDYFLDMNSSNFAWLTDLQIRDVALSAAQLKQLVVVVNLQTLQICHTTDKKHHQAVLNDEVLGSWAFRAQNEGAFPVLKLILLRRIPGVTSKSFKSLLGFPMLENFIVEDTSIRSKHEPVAESHGWRPRSNAFHLKKRKRVRSGGLPHDSSEQGHDEAFRTLIREFIEQRRSDDEPFRSLPILDVSFSAVLPRPQKLGNILHFERHWPRILQARPRDTDTSARPPVESESEEAATEGPEAFKPKKPKLKDGRAIQLDELFDTF